MARGYGNSGLLNIGQQLECRPVRPLGSAAMRALKQQNSMV
jgi:hypothetical protein